MNQPGTPPAVTPHTPQQAPPPPGGPPWLWIALGAGAVLVVIGGLGLAIGLFWMRDAAATAEATPSAAPRVAQSSLQLPSWVPVYPGVRVEGLKTRDLDNGSYSFRSSDDTKLLIDWYGTQLDAQRFATQKYGIYKGQAVKGEATDGRRVVIAVRPEGEIKKVSVVYNKF